MNKSRGRSVATLIAFIVICMLFLNLAAFESFLQTHGKDGSRYDSDFTKHQLTFEKTTAESTNNGSSYQLAHDQSYGFFHDVPSHYWRQYQHIVSEYVRHRNPDDPLEYVPTLAKNTERSGWNSEEAFYGTNYEPNFSCPFERRVGFNGNGDGPKWVSFKRDFCHFCTYFCKHEYICI